MLNVRQLLMIACLLSASFCARAGAQAHSPALALRTEVELQGEAIRLSDLLPAGADDSWRAFGETVLLGRAPEPGSVRVLTLEELRNALEGRTEFAIPAEVTVRRTGWPISAGRVRDAARVSYPSIRWSEAQVRIPPDLGTRTPNARLRVRKIHSAKNPDTLMVRAECQERSDCAPFWAEMIFPGPIGHLPVLRTSSAISAAASPALVRPGRPALLLCDQGGLRISMRVMPLARASLGQTIKVLDPATRRRFLATVEGPNLLHSDLREAK